MMRPPFSLISIFFVIGLHFVFPSTSAQAADPVVWNFNTNENQEVCTPQQTAVQTCWHVLFSELFANGNNFEMKPDPGDGSIHALFINPKALPPGTEDDPRIEGPQIAVDAASYSVVQVRMKSKADRSSDAEKKQIGEIFFKTGDYTSLFNRENYVPFQIINDGEWRTYTIYMGNHPAWTWTITQIRVDPPSNGGYDGAQDDTIAFDFVQIDNSVTTNGAELIEARVNGQNIISNPLVVGSGSFINLQLKIKNVGSRDWTEKNGYYLRWVSGFEAFPNSSNFWQWYLRVPRHPSAIEPGRSRLAKDGTVIDGSVWDTILAGIKAPKKAQEYPIKFQVAQLLIHDGTPNGTEVRFGPEITLTIRVLNGKPAADAGPDMTVYLGDKAVQLDGTASSDPEDDPLAYRWTIISRPQGSNAQLSDPNSAGPILPLDEAGVFTVQLVVSDGKLDSTPDILKVVTLASVTGKTPVIIIPGIYGSYLFNENEILSGDPRRIVTWIADPKGREIVDCLNANFIITSIFRLLFTLDILDQLIGRGAIYNFVKIIQEDPALLLQPDGRTSEVDPRDWTDS
jgi:hypothetical protein